MVQNAAPALVLFLLFCAVNAAGSEQLERLEYPAYVKTSPSSRAYIRMCPSDAGWTDAGKGYVYLVRNAAEDTLLYTVDWFAARSEVYVTNRGRYLVRVWDGLRYSTSHETGISFYKDGVLVRSYAKERVFVDNPVYPHHVDQTGFEGGTAQSRFRLVTRSGWQYLFDVHTGDLIDKSFESPVSRIRKRAVQRVSPGDDANPNPSWRLEADSVLAVTVVVNPDSSETEPLPVVVLLENIGTTDVRIPVDLTTSWVLLYKLEADGGIIPYNLFTPAGCPWKENDTFLLKPGKFYGARLSIWLHEARAIRAQVELHPDCDFPDMPKGRVESEWLEVTRN